MTRDKFDQAAEIKTQIDKLMALDDLLTSASKGRHLLAAIDVDCYGKTTVLNSMALPEEILQGIRHLVALKVVSLDRAFEAL